MLSRFRTIIYLLLTLLLAALGLSPPAEAAERRVEIAANAAGCLQVSEQFAAAEAQRLLPLYSASGQKVLVKEVRLNGGTLHKQRRDEVLQLQMSAAAELPMTLTYTYDAGADADDQRDFLLFPLIGAEHNGVETAEFYLSLPRGFTLARCRIISGDAQSRQNRHVEWEMTQDAFTGRLKLPLQPGEQVWLYVELPQGYWIGARRQHDLSPLLLPPAALLLIGQLTLLRRRQQPPDAPPHRRPMSAYAAEAQLPPLCEYSIIKNGRPEPLEFALQPLLWQNQGCVELCEDSCGAPLLRQVNPLPKSATAAEKLLWARLFANKQGDAAHLSFAAGELAPLLPMAARRTLQSYCSAQLPQAPRRLTALLPALLLLTVQMLNFYRLRLRWPLALTLGMAGALLLLLLLLRLHSLLRKGSLKPAALPLLLLPPLLPGLLPLLHHAAPIGTKPLLISAALLLMLCSCVLRPKAALTAAALPLLLLPPLLPVAMHLLAAYCGAAVIFTDILSAAVLLLTVQAALLLTPPHPARRRALAQIAAQEQQLDRLLQEKPPAVAKNISCYFSLLPLALSQNRADEWTELFAAASAPGSGPSPRLQLHRARCLQQALLPALTDVQFLPHQRRAG